MVPTLFPEAGSYGSAFFLYYRSLICNGLRGPNIANELLHCWNISYWRASPRFIRRTRAHNGLMDPTFGQSYVRRTEEDYGGIVIGVLRPKYRNVTQRWCNVGSPMLIPRNQYQPYSTITLRQFLRTLVFRIIIRAETLGYQILNDHSLSSCASNIRQAKEKERILDIIIKHFISEN